MDSLSFKVLGMDCAECAAHVQKALTEVPGILDAQVYLGAEKAVINIEEDKKVEIESIKSAVSGAGYIASFDTAEEETEEESLSSYSVIMFILIIVFILTATLVGEQFGVFALLQRIIPWFVWLLMITIGGWPVFRNVVRAALNRQIISHSLMSASVLTAIAVGEWATALLIVLFMRFGDFIESKTTERARQSIRELARIAPKSAKVIVDGEEKVVKITSIQNGDIVVVRPGESIPVDGRVIEGNASVDQSAITGESIPVEIYEGKNVYAATILKTGMLILQTTAIGKESTFGRIIRMVEEAEANRGEFQRLADKFAGYYLPIVMLIALATFIIKRDPISAAAVMVVACSCSFSLATPVAMLASIGSAARKGILFKGGKFIESLNKADTVFIDKTGTLTIGKPQITDIFPFEDYSENELIQYCASAEHYSEHPLAEAVLNAADMRDIKLLPVKKFKNIPGKGISAEINGEKITVLNNPLNNESSLGEITDRLLQEGKTLLFVHINNKAVGIIAAEDVLRDETSEAIQTLRRLGINDIKLISGDNRFAVQKIAELLGTKYEGEMTPNQKIQVVKDSQADGRHVVMIGDGINDAPALAQADVGISMGKTGTQIAAETAHIALLREDWKLIPDAFMIAKRTMRVVRLNILFTAIYNLIGLSLAAVGILPPAVSASMQSIPDIGIMVNSARLLRNSNNN